MMRVEDALRKIRLLRRVIPQNGASEFEANTAAHLVQTLMERYSIGKEDIHPVASPRNRMTWVYWEQLLADFGIALDRFGGRASASLGNGALIVIRLAAGHWQVQQASPRRLENCIGTPALNLCVRIGQEPSPILLSGSLEMANQEIRERWSH